MRGRFGVNLEYFGIVLRKTRYLTKSTNSFLFWSRLPSPAAAGLCAAKAYSEELSALKTHDDRFECLPKKSTQNNYYFRIHHIKFVSTDGELILTTRMHLGRWKTPPKELPPGVGTDWTPLSKT